MEHNLIQVYIKDLNEALEVVSEAETIQDFVKLVQLEDRFIKRLRAIAGGKKVYRDFICMISEENENLITARKYFRERETVFKDQVYPAIRGQKPKDLYKMKVNFLFCVFAMKKVNTQDVKLHKLFEEIKILRESLINRHLHYALNRAKAFNTGANASVDFGDLIQLANEALVSAVDKYVIDENSTFRGMAIGRMVANLIASGDQALPVTFGPQASRRLYQIKKLLEKTPNMNTQQISQIIGVAEEEVSAIINASSFTSLDADLETDPSSSAGSVTLMDFLPAPIEEGKDMYAAIEMSDLVRKAAEVFQTLTILEQKILKLKGVNFERLI